MCRACHRHLGAVPAGAPLQTDLATSSSHPAYGHVCERWIRLGHLRQWSELMNETSKARISGKQPINIRAAKSKFHADAQFQRHQKKAAKMAANVCTSKD
eukprot:scaffold9875_cov20-Tisochrysis_lutea.AAC.1